MKWRFTLIGRNNVSTVIDEPVGWDAIEINIKRDLDMHGIFFDFQNNDFQYSGVAMRLIKQEYDQYGVEGHMVQVIEEACEGNEYEELYRGRLLFSRYEKVEGDSCSIKIPMETTSDVMQLRNRWDQKVDLQTNVAFDGAPLPAYNKLGFDLQLPSKGILLQNNAENQQVNATDVEGALNTCSSSIPVSEGGMIEIPFSKTIAGEIGGFFFENQPRYTGYTGTCYPPLTDYVVPPTGQGNLVIPDMASPNVNYAKDFSNFGVITGEVETSFKLKGVFNMLNGTADSIEFVFFRRRKDDTYEWLWNHLLHDYATPLVGPHAFNFDLLYNANLLLNEDDRFYLLLLFNNTRTNAQIAAGPAFNISFDAGNYFRMKTVSHTPATNSKAFMINEAISRVAEGITNNKIKAYSEYFGRTDSQPYSVANDGCGSLEAITKGLFVRRQETRVPVQLNLSMKDLWEGLEPVHHIGFGVEEDPQLVGNKRLRVEPWNFFYKKDIVLYLPDVAEVKTKVIESEHYSTFTFGYQKWEAEEYTGLDEFLTKRIYRTSLSQVKNDLPKLSKFIASGYALEVTRRKGDLDSKDWRYDNDTFLICLKRDNSLLTPGMVGGNLLTLLAFNQIPLWAQVGAVLHIETADNDGNPVPANTGDYTIATVAIVSGYLQIGFTTAFAVNILFAQVTISNINFLGVELGNISNPQNILDPDTLYNYRISPVRNAMRWMNKILASYRQNTAANQIIFTDGDGNYTAAGEMTSPKCKWENGVLSENQSISSANFADNEKAAPLLRPERLELEYPMSVREFKKLLAQPYGLIALNHEQSTMFGWIDEAKYKPEEGTTSYNLIPIFSISNELLEQLNQFIINNP